MSKDKGAKHAKKAPGTKTAGKEKVISDYKAESKTGYGKEPVLNVFTPKSAAKGSGKSNSK